MRERQHVQACVWLLLATAVWGLSFPIIRTLWLIQRELVPEISSFFFASLGGCVRFGVAAIIVAIFCARSLSKLTRSELWQGAGLGVFGGLGIVFQMDGLAHTSASTSAFLTQFYCLLIPIWVSWRRRTVPGIAVVASCIMVLAGVAILSRFDWQEFKLGRGEVETLVSAVFFGGQILWLERPMFANNRVSHFTLVMFVCIAALLAPLAIATAPNARAFVTAYSSAPVAFLMGAIILLCTLGCYTLMNRWQPHVTATEAGLIYCIEPVCASAFAAFLPEWFASFSHIEYSNERVTPHLLIGGGLITAANVLIQIEAALRRSKQKRLQERGIH